jgi:hypothetical protein
MDVKSLLTLIGDYEYDIYEEINKSVIYQPQTKEELQNAVDLWCETTDLWCKEKEEVLVEYGYIGLWDTSKITSMYGLFELKKDFDDDISGWDVSNVTNMAYMFDGCQILNINKPMFNL